MSHHNQQWVTNTVLPYVEAKLGPNYRYNATVDQAVNKYNELREKARAKRRQQKASRKRNRR